MLLMVLGVAISHILAFDPTGGAKIPETVDRILVLLTGLLTSIVSFYFGSRAAETAQQKAQSASGTAATAKPKSIEVKPTSGKPGEKITITGAGFGPQKGSVVFGTVAADMSNATWSDRSIQVEVPSAATPGRVPVTITTAAGAKLQTMDEFEVRQ
jgi:hypothetical protein